MALGGGTSTVLDAMSESYSSVAMESFLPCLVGCIVSNGLGTHGHSSQRAAFTTSVGTNALQK